MNIRRKWSALSILATVAMIIATVGTASSAATTRPYSTNFTLVNLASGANNGSIKFVKPDGSPWKADVPLAGLATLGDQMILPQYTDPNLASGQGSVVVSGGGALGAVVQQQDRTTLPASTSSGAYSGATAGAATSRVPLVARRGNTQQGTANSQIIIQNTSGSADITVEVDLINRATGSKDFTKTGITIKPNASFKYDLDDESNLTTPWFGSAVVRVTSSGGTAAVVTNLYFGTNALQSFSAFTSTGQKWLVPLFLARRNNLSGNPLSTPVTVQNLSGGDIPVGGIKMTCKPSSGANVIVSNKTVVSNNASYAFNPADPGSHLNDFVEGFSGACRVDTTGFETVAFVQMRFISPDPLGPVQRAAAYEAIKADGTAKKVVIPLYAKNVAGSRKFASAVTIVNLSDTSEANVTLTYKNATDEVIDPACNQTFSAKIPAGGNLIQNHRLGATDDGGVPQLTPATCKGTLTVTSSDQPIDGFVQLDFLGLTGDPFMAHTAFTVAN